jgi:hypothetical protein
MAIGFAAIGCRQTPPTQPATIEETLAPTPGVPWFDDVTESAGIRFNHFDSTTPNYNILETMGSGIGWIDYDADGWPDLFCIQAGPLPPASVPSLTHRLYRNNGNGTFTDVTEQVGLARSGFGQGCAVGDYDNDGFDDLVITYFGSVSLFHNEPDPAAPGGRKFRDVTADSDLKNPHWGTSCAWGDVDGDGKLDLYICNYVEIDLARYQPCENVTIRKFYTCSPRLFPKTSHKLFRNLGNGKFQDISESAGLASLPPGAGLAVAMVDLDGDGKLDIYAVNDLNQAYLLHNQGGCKFLERGLASGSGVDRNGGFMAGMGIGIGDVDGSGRPSMVVSNYQDEPTELFLNRGGMSFREWSYPSRLGPATLKTLGFGIDMFDADLDGNLDIILANGHIFRNAPDILGIPQEQRQQLFLGDGAAKFREVTDQAGPYFRQHWIGRGVAVCDFDNDGLPDLAFSNNGGPAKLLRNATDTTRGSLRLALVGDGKTSNSNAIGARIEIDTGGRKLVRFVHGGGSYLSASDRRVLVGLGPAESAGKVTVIWPTGEKQEFHDLKAGGWKLRQGKTQPEPDSLERK